MKHWSAVRACLELERQRVVVVLDDGEHLAPVSARHTHQKLPHLILAQCCCAVDDGVRVDLGREVAHDCDEVAHVQQQPPCHGLVGALAVCMARDCVVG